MRGRQANPICCIVLGAQRSQGWRGHRLRAVYADGKGNWVQLALLAATLLSVVSTVHGQSRTRLIALGWDLPSVETVVKRYAEMEKLPFDGVAVDVVAGRGTRQPCLMRQIFSANPWHRSWFVGLADQLKACQFRRFTDNFVLVGAGPGNVDWFDDAGWAQIADHWRTAAWFARRSGMRGIMFDPEPYRDFGEQFGYSAQSRRSDRSFADHSAKARERGQQVMQAIAEEYPDLILFCLFLNSQHRLAATSDRPEQVLEDDRYGLLPAFVDGWLAAITPGMRIIDGCEAAYRYNSDIEFLDAGLFVTSTSQRLVSPANRAKYRAQVEPSYGFYLDAYANPEGAEYHIDAKGMAPAERLAANLSAASRSGAEYLWIYGESHRWWPRGPSDQTGPNWGEAIPGIENVLSFARDPRAYAAQWLREPGGGERAVELLANGDFGDERTAPIPATGPQERGSTPIRGWSFWQAPGSQGTAQRDPAEGYGAPGSASIAGAKEGCLTQTISVHPDRIYVIRAMRKTIGRGNAGIRICWKDELRGEWASRGWELWVAASPEQGKWEELVGVVRVPPAATVMQVQLTARGQVSPEDTTWFDDATVQQLRNWEQAPAVSREGGPP